MNPTTLTPFICGEVAWQLRGRLVVRAAWRSVLVVALVKVL